MQSHLDDEWLRRAKAHLQEEGNVTQMDNGLITKSAAD